MLVQTHRQVRLPLQPNCLRSVSKYDAIWHTARGRGRAIIGPRLSISQENVVLGRGLGVILPVHCHGQVMSRASLETKYLGGVQDSSRSAVFGVSPE